MSLFLKRMKLKLCFFYSLAPPVVGCQSDPECPTDKACFNTQCVDPCNCGINAECSVINHKPLCYCPAGYSGNPEVECQKCKLHLISKIYVFSRLLRLFPNDSNLFQWNVKLTPIAEQIKSVTTTSVSIPAFWTTHARSTPFVKLKIMLHDVSVLPDWLAIPT